MILLTPLLAGETGKLGESLLFHVTKGIGIILFVIASAKWIVPRVLYQITRTRSRELFLLTVVLICLSVAWLTYSAGLSLALGAFLAGLIISESEYGHQALGNILPFRDVFMSFFFVSIGMLFDFHFFLQQPVLIVLITVGVLALKTMIAGFSTTLLGFPLRTVILVGIALSQVGEFSFILSEVGVEYGLLAGNTYQMFLAVSVLTMSATPFIVALAPRIADFALRLPIPKMLKIGLYPIQGLKDKGEKDHLIIIGFGVNGRNLARAARAGDIPYVIIEMNPEVVRDEKAKGEPICYGDATQEAILQHADIKDARIVVVAINDPSSTRRITEIIRQVNPGVYIIVRTQYLQEMKPLYELGANEVIPEEFETSVEIFSRVLAKYLVPREEIERFITEVRSDGYEMFRSHTRESASFSDLKHHFHDIEISTFQIGEESSMAGKSLAQIELRKKYGVTILAIRRNSKMLYNPDGYMQLCAGDVLFALGPPDKITTVMALFHNPEEREANNESNISGSN